MTISNIAELLEIVKRPSISHDLGSRLAKTYLNALDMSQTKEELVKELTRIAARPDCDNLQYIMLQNPLL